LVGNAKRYFADFVIAHPGRQQVWEAGVAGTKCS
jgi:hypothetical protein